MASRFMKIKKMIIPVMTAVIIASQLSGCAIMNRNDMLDLLSNGEEIVLELASPEYTINVQGQQAKLTRVQLDSLQTYIASGFRDDFDELFGVTPLEVNGKQISKQGCIYVNSIGYQDGNTSFMDSLRNKEFMDKFTSSESKISALGEEAYADVDADTHDAVMAALNAYYNLFAEAESGEDDYFNPTQSVTRGEFYSFVYRASNGVVEDLTTLSGFESAVGVSASEDENVVYASQVANSAWLNSANTGLRPGNYKQSISRAEAVYLLLNQFFSNDFRNYDVTSSGITLGDATDGGDFTEDTDGSWFSTNELVDKDGNKVEGYELGALSKMLEAGDGKVQSDLYKALVMAADLGIIDANETRYDEPVSRSEAIDMMVKVGQALNEKEGYLNETTPTINIEDEYYIPDGYPTQEEVEQELGVELPPVEVWYVHDYDTDNNGTISKDEWEKWKADHPEDTNQNMNLSDDKVEEPETQTPVIPSDGGGNPDSGAGNDAGQSTGNQGGSGNTGGNSSSVNPGTQGGNQTTPPSTPSSEESVGGSSTPGGLTEQEQAIVDDKIDRIEAAGGYYDPSTGATWVP